MQRNIPTTANLQFHPYCCSALLDCELLLKTWNSVMLHRNRAIQDENDPRVVRGKLYTAESGPKTAKKSMLGPGKVTFDAENPMPSKSAKPTMTVPRKALGDITNATPVSHLASLNPSSTHVLHLWKTLIYISHCILQSQLYLHLISLTVLTYYL